MSTKKLTLEQFITKAHNKHGNKYDYSKVNYINSRNKVIITCLEHGDFLQNAGQHLEGYGCPTCGIINRAKNNTLSNEAFILKANKIHNNKYCYDNINYTNNKEKIIIMCPIHGEFTQIADTHLRGSGCPECAISARILKTTISTKNFINTSSVIHNNKYNYSKTNYIHNNKKVIIICPEHGEFEQYPRNHLSGFGCFECGILFGGFTKSTFIKASLKNKNSLLYIIKCFNSDEEFIKIGITSKSIKRRFSSHTSLPYSYKIIEEIKGSPDFIFDEEKKLHRLLKQYKYTPQIFFKGKEECFTLSSLPIIKQNVD